MRRTVPASIAPGKIRPGRYRHYKGKDYQVLGMAKHSETLDELVLYVPLYGEGGYWVRPAAMFAETVEVNGEPVARFQYLGPLDPGDQ